MANLLKLTSIGQGARTHDPTKIESLVPAGLGVHAHMNAPDYAAQDVIDAAQNSVSDINRGAGEISSTIETKIPHTIMVAGSPIQYVTHHKTPTLPDIHIPIPEQNALHYYEWWLKRRA